MVTHGNLLYNLKQMNRGVGFNKDSVIVTWLPAFHDMGLIFGLLQPVCAGVPCYQMSPMDFLQRPIRWLQAISDYRGTHSAAPNFAYDLSARKTTPEQRAELDLSSWICAGNGAEPIRRGTLVRFLDAFGTAGFRAETMCTGYGLAEATLRVSNTPNASKPVFLNVVASELEQHRVVEAEEDNDQTRTLVGCGRMEDEIRAIIVDPESLLQCSPDRVGEIWVTGPTVAQGYWGRAEETEKVFRARMVDTNEGPFLRTGDLGFTKDGELFITGRLKDLIIIGGTNHYPQDIERTVELSHPAVRPGCAAAFSVDGSGEERLAVVLETKQSMTEEERKKLLMAIRSAVSAAHDLRIHDVVLIKARSIFKTSSGKIQRHACKAAYLDGSLEQV